MDGDEEVIGQVIREENGEWFFPRFGSRRPLPVFSRGFLI
jgi:hypothetical protein